MLRVGLFLLYYAVVTPVGLVCRLVRDPLHRAWNDRATSYLIHHWTPASSRGGTGRGRSDDA
ncbi:hypothetical protein [Kutzneria kofuensis]|uniref:hypothetical protein n=1 Tax=Kutzneria kofuensis TaxID=103725 RepID=UPI0031ED634D